MYWIKKAIDAENEVYRNKQQEYHQTQWDDPIDVKELIYSNYESKILPGAKKEIVFINSNDDLEWRTSYDLEGDVRSMVNDVMEIRVLPYKHLPYKQRFSFLRTLGQGVVAALSNCKDDVNDCIEQANYLHERISIDAFKNRSLQVSTLIFVVFLILFEIQERLVTLDSTLLCMVLWSFVGTYVSIFFKTSSSDRAIAYNDWFIFWNIVSRFVIGMIFGIIALYLVDIEFLNVSTQDSRHLSILAFVAGFSEKFIPDALGHYENKFSKGSCGCRNASAK